MGSSDGTRPRTRQRVYKAPPPLEVPDIEQDAAERKRVLNVLAQRRYREKKRQMRLKARGEGSQSSEEPQPIPRRSFDSDEIIELPMHHNTSTSCAVEFLPAYDHSPVAQPGTPIDMDYVNWDLDDVVLASMVPEPGAMPEFITDATTGPDMGSMPSAMFPTSGSPSPGLFMPEVNTFTSTTTITSNSTDPSSHAPSPSLALASSSDLSLADSVLLPVHELTLLRAMLRIAKRLGCTEEVWSLEALSPFTQGQGTPADQLPEAWRPTTTQILVPHHPVVDFLPWPTVREKVLEILSLPDDARPPHASGPMALINLVYDLEHQSEGVRIYGADPYDPQSWEVGQVLFERWWFVFDRDVIENSNKWRALRGAAPLTMGTMTLPLGSFTKPTRSPGRSASISGSS